MPRPWLRSRTMRGNWCWSPPLTGCAVRHLRYFEREGTWLEAGRRRFRRHRGLQRHRSGYRPAGRARKNGPVKARGRRQAPAGVRHRHRIGYAPSANNWRLRTGAWAATNWCIARRNRTTTTRSSTAAWSRRHRTWTSPASRCAADLHADGALIATEWFRDPNTTPTAPTGRAAAAHLRPSVEGARRGHRRLHRDGARPTAPCWPGWMRAASGVRRCRRRNA